MGDNSNNFEWYVFVTQTHKERLAVEQLQAQAFEVFVPMHLKTVSHARKQVTKPVPLFPGYGFVGFDRTRVQWRCINGTRGVKHLISQGERPLPVPGSVITSLKYLENERGLITFESRFKPDDKVRFIAGPFFGLIGKLAKVNRNGRIEVLLQILNSEVNVKTDAHNMQPA